MTAATQVYPYDVGHLMSAQATRDDLNECR
jgi:hypothetical protein